MASTDWGKREICGWIREHFNPGAEILDVGACDGKWRKMLPEYTMDAVEAFRPNAERIKPLYRNVYAMDIRDIRMTYGHYDLIIFGDVLEHLQVSEAQAVLAYAKNKSGDILIGVPWRYKQGQLYGNPYEVHIQDDLTPEIFVERYPGFEPVLMGADYGYYHRRAE